LPMLWIANSRQEKRAEPLHAHSAEPELDVVGASPPAKTGHFLQPAEVITARVRLGRRRHSYCEEKRCLESLALPPVLRFCW
jgi:hypothetical protein